MKYKCTKICPHCHKSIIMDKKAMYKAKFIHVTWGGPRVYCPHCHKSLDFGYSTVPFIALLVSIVGGARLFGDNPWLMLPASLLIWLFVAAVHLHLSPLIKS